MKMETLIGRGLTIKEELFLGFDLIIVISVFNKYAFVTYL